MIRSFFLTVTLTIALSLMGIILSLTSCKEERAIVSKSPNGRIVVYEGRKYGVGLAPDLVKIYLFAVSATPTTSMESVFEGQDISRVCYDWSTSSELNVRISDGYVDQVASQWQAPDGHRITIRYIGTSGCVWRKSS